MTLDRGLAAAWVLFALLLSWWIFPGHAYLTSDTQIYAPILENLRDPSLFSNELLAAHPHVRFTVYDEVTNTLRSLFHLSLESALQFQQFLYRLLGLVGVWLVARRLSLSAPLCGLVCTTVALSAFVGGPAVFTIEVEPVPRGFAICLLLLALGLVAWERWWWAAAAVAVAFLYHPPVVVPFALVLLLARWRLWPALAAAALLLGAAALTQVGLIEPQPLFAQVATDVEKLQKLRAAYNWLSLWPAHFLWQYPLLAFLNVAAWYRLRDRLPRPLSLFVVGLPVIGIVMMPVSYLLLDVARWSLMPEWQPARAVVFCTLGVMLFGSIAAVIAVQAKRYWEAPLWFLAIYGLPMFGDLFTFLSDWRFDDVRLKSYLVVALAALATGGIVLSRASKGASCVAAALAAFFLIPLWGLVRPFPTNLDNRDTRELAAWAQTTTPAQTVFLFPKAKEFQGPGVFRARALRPVYVDWKSGGQVNFSPAFAREWWARWQDTMASGAVKPLLEYRTRGIDYIVLSPNDPAPEGATPSFRNNRFAVYAVPPPISASTSWRVGMDD